MNNPDVGDLHVDALLTELSIAFMNPDDAYIADKIFPRIGVQKQSDVYALYEKDAWFRDFGAQMRRAPGTKAARSGWTVDLTNTYLCQNEAIATGIADELRGNADSIFDLDLDATKFVTNAQMMRRERMFVADFMKTGTWTTDKTGGSSFTLWSDYASSDPIGDVESWHDTLRQLIGRRGNKMPLGAQVWRHLKNHPDILDRLKYGQTPGSPAKITRNIVAGLFELDELLVFEGVYATNGEDTTPATVTLADIVANDALLCYVPSAPSRLTPAAGYTFVWEPLAGGGASPHYIRRYREDQEGQDVFESRAYFDQVKTAADAAVFISGAVA